jgi:hypothetical protein
MNPKSHGFGGKESREALPHFNGFARRGRRKPFPSLF